MDNRLAALMKRDKVQQPKKLSIDTKKIGIQMPLVSSTGAAANPGRQAINNNMASYRLRQYVLLKKY